MVAREEIPGEPVKEAQIQPEEELKEINLGAELGSQKPVFTSSQLIAQKKRAINGFTQAKHRCVCMEL